jgi:DNA-binding MarR family transcriptional regulator
MNAELDQILNGDDNKPKIQCDVDKMVNLLQELRVEFQRKMEEVILPIKLKRKNPLEILNLKDDELTSSHRLILLILWNMDEVTTEYLLGITGLSYGGTKRLLRELVGMGYILKLKNGVFKVNENPIF